TLRTPAPCPRARPCRLFPGITTDSARTVSMPAECVEVGFAGPSLAETYRPVPSHTALQAKPEDSLAHSPSRRAEQRAPEGQTWPRRREYHRGFRVSSVRDGLRGTTGMIHERRRRP